MSIIDQEAQIRELIEENKKLYRQLELLNHYLQVTAKYGKASDVYRAIDALADEVSRLIGLPQEERLEFLYELTPHIEKVIDDIIEKKVWFTLNMVQNGLP